MPRIAVVGAGWAGLSAAIAAVQAGHHVQVFEMARDCGGRARSHDSPHGLLDNGQHILIGAYRESLRLMRLVGVDIDRALLRSPLNLRYPDGAGLALPAGSPSVAFALGVLGTQGWSLQDRVALLVTALKWRLRGFVCPTDQTVTDLCHDLPPAIVRELVEPLCAAALNTPMRLASGQVFLRVLRDALFGGPGSADLLLPRVGLSELFAQPATQWLQDHGVAVHHGQRIAALDHTASGWCVDGALFDAVVLSTTAREAARLTELINPVWSATARGLDHQPIITVWLSEPSLTLGRPMVAMRSDRGEPAQFGFELSALGGAAGMFTFVVSDAARWIELGIDFTLAALLQQVRRAFVGKFADDGCVRHVHIERRATFNCQAGLRRPPARIAAGLVAAADYVDGPYPATLEGAVQSGQQAVAIAIALPSCAPPDLPVISMPARR